MDLSIAVISYNTRDLLLACLQSVWDRTTDVDYEVIVVDNGSSDGTAKIAEQYGAKIIFESQQGILVARNAGFNAARGDVIARIDADSRAPKDWIFRIRNHFVAGDADALAGMGYAYDALVRTAFPLWINFVVIKMLLGNKEPLLGFNMAMRRSMWLAIRDQLCTDETQVHEDIDLAIHIHQAGGKIIRDKDLVCATSARRMFRHPRSLFWEYPRRTWHTVKIHRQQPRGILAPAEGPL